jgi:hypothetical protein
MNAPVYALRGTSISTLVDTLAADASRARAKALNDWLARCVERWCPKAYALQTAGGLSSLASQALAEGGFHWTTQAYGLRRSGRVPAE